VPAGVIVGPEHLPAGVPFVVELRRSTKRRKSVGAGMVDGRLVVTVPSWMGEADRLRWAGEMASRYARKTTTEGVDLLGRAVQLARRYRLPEPASVRWFDMASRWGSCTPASGDIRVSTRVGAFPGWVLDYVLVHELAHLEAPDHSRRFWDLVDRYPLTERARGFLIAKSDGDVSPDSDW
jgi:hypothetical protein